MWDRIREGRSQVERYTEGLSSRPGRRPSRRPLVEVLEERQLLTSASLQPIANLSVPSLQGATVPLLAGTGQTDAQTYTVTSSNPDIAASIATGPFWNVGVAYADPSNSANNFTGTLTFQLFQGLTPNTVSEISNLTNDGYFVNTGKFFSRVLTGFVVQGGSPTINGAEPNPPVQFANENVQQLAFTGIDQLAMANTGQPDSNSSQFFVTLANENASLGYGFTIFGQLLTGVNTLNQMAAVPVGFNNSFTPPEKSQPLLPLVLSSATLTSTNPNGVLLLDTTQAMQGENSTITVTATDPTNGTKTSESFVVVVGPYAGPASPTINFRPFATSFTAHSTNIQLQGQLAPLPDATTPGTLSYQIVDQPEHGTISDFNPTTGTLVYNEQAGFAGPVTFTYETVNTNSSLSPSPTTSNPATVTINTTGAVQVIGTTLVVTPPPHGGHKKNVIDVAEVPQASGASNLEVEVNGVVDPITIAASSISRIIVFGGKGARNTIQIDSSVTIPATISGGQGIKNRDYGGGGETREHGWFGSNVLIGGVGPNQLIGLKGHVRFRPTKSTTEAFLGVPKRRTADLNPTPPGGTYFVFKKGHLVPVIKF
jgi:cyclophilin family peptidyl-prolyl cis-trans isomerase